MKYIIDWMEKRKTPTGKDVINASLKTPDGVVHDKVSIWGDFPSYHELRPGGEVDGEIKANAKGYKSLYEEKTKGFSSTGRAPSGAVKAAEITRESVKEAQEKKNESIAYFNSLNCALQTMEIRGSSSEVVDSEEFKEGVKYWRDFYLSEWQKYEAKDVTDKRNPF